MQQKTRPLICFPQKLTLKQLPREPNPNHNLAVTTVFCVQGDSVRLRTRYQIKPPKIMNVCFYRALSFVVCACTVNVVFPLLNKIFCLFQITYKNSKSKIVKRRDAELWNLCCNFFFFTAQRQWDSSEQDLFLEPLQDPEIRCAVKRLFSGTPLLPRLSCRPQPLTSTQRIKHSRSLGTLTSCMSREL